MEGGSKLLTASIIETVIAIVILVFSIMLLVHMNASHYEEVGEIGWNWKETPIYTFSFDSCNSGNKTNILKGNKFAGTSTGCHCTGYLSRGYCTDDERDRHFWCSNVYAVYEKTYIFWRKAQICKDKPDSFSYLNTTIYENNCPENMKSCGYIDSLKNLLCVSPSENCPYNKVRILGKNDPNPAGDTYTEYPFGSYKLIAANNPNETLIVTFKISDDTPCADPDYVNTLQPYYKLDNKYDKRGCSLSKMGNQTYDNRYTQVADSYSYVNLLSENGLYQSVAKLPNIEIRNIDTKLYTRGFIGIKQVCKSRINLANLEYSKLIDFLIYIGDDMSTNYSFTIVILVFASIDLALIIFCVVTSISKIEMYMITRGIKLICDILLLIFICLFYSRSGSYGNDLVLLQNNCLDEISDFSVNTFDITLSKIQTDLLVLLIFILIVYGLIAVAFLIYMLKPVLENCLKNNNINNNSYQPPQSNDYLQGNYSNRNANADFDMNKYPQPTYQSPNQNNQGYN